MDTDDLRYMCKKEEASIRAIIEKKGYGYHFNGFVSEAYDYGGRRYVLSFGSREDGTDHRMGGFSLNPYSNNCGILILNALFIYNSLLKCGLCVELLKLAVAIAQAEGFSYIQCTAQTEGQERFITIAKKFGFVEIDSFHNLRSENDITVLSLNVTS